MKILVINGPNMNLLGEREPDIYGKDSLSDINELLAEYAKKRGHDVGFFQSNHEGAIVDEIGRARSKYDALIINPAAYTHTSVAIADAIRASGLPAVEVHISNIFSREQFRSSSLTAPACRAVISGFGSHGYVLALQGLEEIVKK